MRCQGVTAAQGIHYTERSRPRPPLPPKDNVTISSAFHDLQQLDVKYGALDYAFLSPIFDSISKAGYQAAFDLDDLTTCIAACTIPLVALGGITAANIPQVKRLGFSGAAVLGSVWSSSDPVVACTELLTACAAS
ncbi:MAG: thiamine monophosphate synthase [Trebouxia sp. A1-2]|nr:MAG: thiamine monophosphate synthase [Trebouxia sp. A1-2]